MPGVCLQILWCLLHVTDMCSSIMTYFFPSTCHFSFFLPCSTCQCCIMEKRQCLSVLAFSYLLKRMAWWFIVNCVHSKSFIGTLYHGTFPTLRFFFVTCVFHKDWLLHFSEHFSAAVEMVMCGFSSLMRLSNNHINSF